MRLLLDQDVFALTARFLKDSGHDVVTAANIESSRASDSELLRTAHKEGRILVTRDRDFGGPVYLEGLGAGVAYLRVLPSTLNAVHLELERVLTT